MAISDLTCSERTDLHWDTAAVRANCHWPPSNAWSWWGWQWWWWGWLWWAWKWESNGYQISRERLSQNVKWPISSKGKFRAFWYETWLEENQNPNQYICYTKSHLQYFEVKSEGLKVDAWSWSPFLLTFGPIPSFAELVISKWKMWAT